MTKNNQKCLRLNDEVLRIVSEYHGNGFNEKFENMVIDFHKSAPERELYIKSLDEKIGCQQTQLRELSESINQAVRVQTALQQFLLTLESSINQ